MFPLWFAKAYFNYYVFFALLYATANLFLNQQENFLSVFMAYVLTCLCYPLLKRFLCIYWEHSVILWKTVIKTITALRIPYCSKFYPIKLVQNLKLFCITEKYGGYQEEKCSRRASQRYIFFNIRKYRKRKTFTKNKDKEFVEIWIFSETNRSSISLQGNMSNILLTLNKVASSLCQLELQITLFLNFLN